MTSRFVVHIMALAIAIASLASSGAVAGPASAIVRAQWKVCLAEPMGTLLHDPSCRATMTQMGLTPADIVQLQACSAMTPQQRYADSHCQQLLRNHPGAMG